MSEYKSEGVTVRYIIEYRLDSHDAWDDIAEVGDSDRLWPTLSVEETARRMLEEYKAGNDALWRYVELPHREYLPRPHTWEWRIRKITEGWAYMVETLKEESCTSGSTDTPAHSESSSITG